jgi:hypothetical protein
MSDPLRYSRDPDNELARTLLRSARTYAPSPTRRRPAVAAASVLATSSLTTGTAGGALAKVGTLAALKWVGIAVVVGITTVGATVAIRENTSANTLRHQTRVSPTTPATTGPAPTTPLTPTIPSASPDSSATAIPSPLSAPTLKASPTANAIPTPVLAAVERPTIADEVASLQQASSALAGSNPTRALAILDAYSARFADPSLAAEAEVLRIEALAQNGDVTAARRRADRFLAAYPQSPYGARI